MAEDLIKVEDLQAKITELEGFVQDSTKIILEKQEELATAHSTISMWASGAEESKGKITELEAEITKLKGEADLGAQLVAGLNAKLEAAAKPAGELVNAAKQVAIDRAIRNMAQRLKVSGHLAEVNEYEKALKA